MTSSEVSHSARGRTRGREETGRTRLNLVDGRTSGTWTSHRQEVFEEESIRFTTNFTSASVEFIHNSIVEKRTGLILVVAWGVRMPRGCRKQRSAWALAAGRTSDEERTKPAAKTLDLDQLSWASGPHSRHLFMSFCTRSRVPSGGRPNSFLGADSTLHQQHCSRLISFSGCRCILCTSNDLCPASAVSGPFPRCVTLLPGC